MNIIKKNFDFIIVSHPGRHGCTNPGNKGLIAINNGISQTYIDKDDFKLYESDGWKLGGKHNHKRTAEQIENISRSHKGISPWNKGKKLSEEQKRNMKHSHNLKIKRTFSEEDILNLRMKNIKRVKINKDNIEKQIPLEELEEYLSKGWKKGIIKKISLFKKPDGSLINYNKSSAIRNHKDWIFIKDLSD